MYLQQGPSDLEVLALLIGCGVSIWLIVLFVRLYYRVTQIRDALYAAFDLEDAYDYDPPPDGPIKRFVRRRQRKAE